MRTSLRTSPRSLNPLRWQFSTGGSGSFPHPWVRENSSAARPCTTSTSCTQPRTPTLIGSPTSASSCSTPRWLSCPCLIPIRPGTSLRLDWSCRSRPELRASVRILSSATRTSRWWSSIPSRTGASLATHTSSLRPTSASLRVRHSAPRTDTIWAPSVSSMTNLGTIFPLAHD